MRHPKTAAWIRELLRFEVTAFDSGFLVDLGASFTDDVAEQLAWALEQAPLLQSVTLQLSHLTQAHELGQALRRHSALQSVTLQDSSPTTSSSSRAKALQDILNALQRHPNLKTLTLQRVVVDTSLVDFLQALPVHFQQLTVDDCSAPHWSTQCGIGNAIGNVPTLCLSNSGGNSFQNLLSWNLLLAAAESVPHLILHNVVATGPALREILAGSNFETVTIRQSNTLSTPLQLEDVVDGKCLKLQHFCLQVPIHDAKPLQRFLNSNTQLQSLVIESTVIKRPLSVTREIVEGILQCSSLSSLTLDHVGELDTLRQLLQMPQLESLHLQGLTDFVSLATALPDSSLRHLKLSRCGASTMVLHRLPSTLQSLDVSCNHQLRFDVNWHELLLCNKDNSTPLLDLDISYNTFDDTQFQTLVDAVHDGARLRKLRLGPEVAHVEQLFPALTHNPYLQVLDMESVTLSETALTVLVSTVGSFPALQFLALGVAKPSARNVWDDLVRALASNATLETIRMRGMPVVVQDACEFYTLRNRCKREMKGCSKEDWIDLLGSLSSSQFAESVLLEMLTSDPTRVVETATLEQGTREFYEACETKDSIGPLQLFAV